MLCMEHTVEKYNCAGMFFWYRRSEKCEVVNILL